MANSGDKILYFLIGGFVGASVALLFAPRSGEETRRLIETKYREGSEFLNEKVQEGRRAVEETGREWSERLNQTVDRGRETVSRQREQVAAALDAGRAAYQQEKSKLEKAEDS